MTVAAWAFRTCVNSVCLPALLLLLALGKAACQGGVYVDAIVPAEHEVVGEDQYVCFRVDLPKSSLKIVGVDPLSTQDVVHHMLLFGKHHVPHSEHVPLHFLLRFLPFQAPYLCTALACFTSVSWRQLISTAGLAIAQQTLLYHRLCKRRASQ